MGSISKLKKIIDLVNHGNKSAITFYIRISTLFKTVQCVGLSFSKIRCDVSNDISLLIINVICIKASRVCGEPFNVASACVSKTELTLFMK